MRSIVGSGIHFARNPGPTAHGLAGVGAGSLPWLPSRVGDGDAQRGDPGQVQTCGSVHVETDFHGVFMGYSMGIFLGIIPWEYEKNNGVMNLIILRFDADLTIEFILKY